MSSDRRSSLSAPSTNSHFSIRAMRRSTAAKASKSISAAMGSLTSSPLPAGWDAAAARSSLEASIMASTFAGSIRVIRGWNGFNWWLASRVWWSAQVSGATLRKASAAAASFGSTGLRKITNWRNRLMPRPQTAWTLSCWPSCLASAQGACSAIQALARSARAMISRMARLKSRAS